MRNRRDNIWVRGSKGFVYIFEVHYREEEESGQRPVSVPTVFIQSLQSSH